MSDANAKPAEQDGEYLHEARNVILRALVDVDPEGRSESDLQDTADWVLDKLAEAGWHLFNAADAREVIDTWAMGKLR